jgi:predicted transcriptional regulator
MARDRTRVDFNAPTPLVERADHLAELLDTSRSRILVDALREELEALARDETVRRRVREAFYASKIEFETTESILGTADALRMQLLDDAIDREPPEPRVEELPDAPEFYDGGVPEYSPRSDPSDEDTGPTA